ncbi:curli-like amyloid fiber formation chaperone CsgH [Maricaulis sp.]|uniref:curli-like amyloid fiber formation chaperone CsgH n=1 Tax=Maricaulis sp. TaxID=1486257 RepID=UPI0025C02C34|nr:curli-like amyloid fiber formation chaperone CsgH [Maricaulis sp.]
MGMKLISLSSLAAMASIWFAVEVDEAPLEARLADMGSGSACGIDLTETVDGLVVTAWSAPEAGASWDMIITQRTGGGSFDIRQSGDIEPYGEGAVILSDITLDMETDFNARLSTWSPQGELLCRWGGNA